MNEVIIVQKKYRRAFTLIELLVVLIIISVMLVFAVPRLGALYDRQLVEQQIRLIEKDLLWLRSEARRTGAAAMMQSGVEGGYRLTVVVGGETKSEQRTLVSERLQLSTNARYGQVVFQPQGTAFEKCTLTIRSGKEVRTVVVNNLGRIRVGRGHG